MSETQGIVLAEAMAAGLPVIAVDAPGVRDIVEDGFNGRLISEAGEMRFALWWHITLDDEEKRQLAENARKTAEGYSIESTTDAILGIYDSLIEENGVTLKRRDSDWPRMVQRYLKGEFALFGGFTSSLARSVLGSDQNRRRKN